MAVARKPVIKARAPAVDGPIPRFGEVAQQLTDNGYAVVPLHYGKKTPCAGNDWPDYTFAPKDIVGALSYKNRGTGILTGKIVGVDIDIRDSALAGKLEALAEKMLGKAPRRIGQAPKVLRIYRTDAPFPKIISSSVVLPSDAEGDKPHRVEILGAGQQFVTFNQHPDTGKAYRWNGAGDPLTIPASQLPSVTEKQMRAFIDAANKILADAAAGTTESGLPPDLERELQADAREQAEAYADKQTKKLEATDPDECRSALKAIPNADCDYDQYIKIGHAVAGALGAEGCDAWHEWAAKSGKYDHAKTESDWQGFMRIGKLGKLKSGAGTIFQEAYAAGWKAPPKNPAPKDDAFVIESLSDEWLTEEPPPQDWYWESIVPQGSVTALNSEGGAGKTWLTTRMCEASAHGSANFMTFRHDPRSLKQGTTVIINAEDGPEVLRRRLWSIQQRKIANMARHNKDAALAKKIAEYRARLKKHFKAVHLVGKQFALIEVINGRPEWGPGHALMMQALRKLENIVLVVLDPLARMHTGDENSSTIGTMVVNAAETIAQEFNCAVIISHHVSKEVANHGKPSANSGRGSSGFGYATRSVLQMIPADLNAVKGLRLLRQSVDPPGEIPIEPQDVTDGYVVVLHHVKTNYGAKQRPLYMLRDKHTGELLPLKVVTDVRDMDAANLQALAEWLATNPTTVTKELFRDATELRKKVFGGALSKTTWLVFFETLVATGKLVPDPGYSNKNPKAVGYQLADGYPLARQIPASGTAGMLEDGEEAGGRVIPAAKPISLGGGYPFGGYPEGSNIPANPSRRTPRKGGTRRALGGYPDGAG